MSTTRLSKQIINEIILQIAQGEIFSAFIGRRIIQKHKSYAMYHPGLHHISQVILDIPILFLQSVLYGTIVYFMVGLDHDAGKFFIFLFLLTLHALLATSFIRFLGNISKSIFMTQALVGLITTVMIIYFGYAINFPKMHPWVPPPPLFVFRVTSPPSLLTFV